MIKGSLVLSLWMLETEYSGFGDQYHACWCLGDLSRQGITRHGIDYRICNICGCSIGNLVFFCWAKSYIWCEYIFYNLKTIQCVKSWYGYPLGFTLCCVLYFSCSKLFHLLSIKFSWCCDRSILLLLWSFLAICCGKQVLFQNRNTKIQVAYLLSC